MLKYDQYIKESKKLNASPMSTFISAAKNGSNSKIKELIKSGIDINIKDFDGKTALMLACTFNYLMVVYTLIDAGANVNEVDRNGQNALVFATTSKIIDKLLESGIDVNNQDTDGETPAMSLYYPEQLTVEILEKFLKKGLNLDIKNHEGKNLYDIIEEKIEWLEENNGGYRLNYYKKLEKFIDDRFPQYKEEWDLKKNMNKYNL